MRRINLVVILIWISVTPSFAQSIDSSAEYYISSAFSKFTNICLQDGKLTSDATSYRYYFGSKSEEKNNSQLWTFTSASESDSTLYYIRNSRTRLYLSAEIITSGKFWLWTSASKTSAKPFTITDLGNGQITLSALDDYGVRYYMHATDTTTTLPTFRNIKLCSNSRFAWTLQKHTEPTQIHSVDASGYPPAVSVLDRQIVVSNATNYQIYDISGKIVNSQEALQPGIYIVKGDNLQRKVIVK